MNFYWRKGNIGIKFDSEKDQHVYYPQVVQYYYDEDDVDDHKNKKEYNYTIAAWDKNSEGYEFRSIGNRFFESLLEKVDYNGDYIKEVLSMCNAFGKLLDTWWESNRES